MLKRIMGKASFCTVRDFTGTMQYFVQQNEVGSDAYAAFKTFDLGDIVAAKGVLFRTHAGDLAIRVKEIRLMTKSIRPLPDKHKGLQDTELCYRQRYVDLIMNEESRNRFLTRSKAIAAIRAFMLNHRFLEVETPMLHPILAAPMQTLYHAPQCARYGYVPANRAGTVSEAPRGRRF